MRREKRKKKEDLFKAFSVLAGEFTLPRLLGALFMIMTMAVIMMTIILLMIMMMVMMHADGGMVIMLMLKTMVTIIDYCSCCC